MSMLVPVPQNRLSCTRIRLAKVFYEFFILQLHLCDMVPVKDFTVYRSGPAHSDPLRYSLSSTKLTLVLLQIVTVLFEIGFGSLFDPDLTPEL